LTGLSCCNDTSNADLYSLSLHDALPIYSRCLFKQNRSWRCLSHEGKTTVRINRDYHRYRHALLQTLGLGVECLAELHNVNAALTDRKSTRLNSSHVKISYAVFCLKKKKE